MNRIIGILLTIISLTSCKNSEKKEIQNNFHSEKETQSEFNQPNADFHNLELDFMNWWIYHNNNIILSSDFVPINISSKKISKEVFLRNLTTGDFIPLKLKSKDSVTYYKLFRLSQTSAKDIRNTIKNVSISSLKNYKLEGENFPDFNFKDINDVEYNNVNTKGKIVILKCWFINCKACVAEFPQLNNLVKKYQNRDDILFISLAFESKDKLKEFIDKNPFSYATVSDKRKFMEDSLKIHSYPTHFVIDKKGVIQKVVSKADEMISFIEDKELMKNNQYKESPPPSSKK